MIGPQDIEKLEKELQKMREQGGGSVAIGPPRNNSAAKPKLPTVILTRVIRGKEVILTATPTELIESPGSSPMVLASALRVEQKRPHCNAECRIVRFKNPVRIENNSIFIKPLQVIKGRQRFQRLQGEWQPFNLWLVFSGSKRDRNLLEVLGVG